VKDNETLDADALLKSLRDSDKASNEERKRLGMPSLHTLGWSVPPHYDAETKRLEWGLGTPSQARLGSRALRAGRTGMTE
jgi:uncharacterized membrane-anchored protein